MKQGSFYILELYTPTKYCNNYADITNTFNSLSLKEIARQ